MTENRNTNSNQGPLVERIRAAMFRNAGLFLKKAAEEIADHADAGDDPFDVDRATLVTVLMQTAVELATTATVLQHEGLAGVVRPKDLPATDAEAEARWEAGTIRTRTFDDLKSKAANYLGDEAFWSIVEFLQRTRNKLVHFHVPLHDGDRFDLQYDAIHVLIQIATALTKYDEHEFAFGCSDVLGLELFHRLISSEPYRDGIEAQAREIDPEPLKCGACGARAFLRDEETCLSCGYSGEIKLLKCPQCHEHTVFYDHLNLPFNDMLDARCGRCDWEGLAAHCDECDDDYPFEGHSPAICPWCDE
ncbi:hypothetical protein [Burkholderia ubonensis]|uniref:hypothetical protein n=1 Tax=Burkholderia ubonensis TaxID=101571 RepID=UPI0012FC249D|nr:hypothetical protein [Burkholderia ubonensis]